MEIESLTLKNTLSEIEVLPPLMAKLSSQFSLNKELSGSLNLALEEALVNVISYAYPENTEGWIQLSISYQPTIRVLCFELKDKGAPFDPTAVPEADIELSVNERPIGGLGILLIKNIMDDVKYSYLDNCNVLTMTKKI